ncbi:MAG: ATP-binding protein [Azonexus sp.]|jgi:anti-sigma regulatory factor (Ser/Thr protein kinase)|nr:ATP-binding protein [Azonexus sp.]
MTTHSTDFSVGARFSELPGLIRLLVADARQLGVSDEDSRRLQLIAEELFTNTVAHGFGHDSEAPVRLELERHASGITLRYSDSAPAYDPTANPQQTASANKAGGLGVTLIRGMCRDFRYRRQDGRNICEIDL